jgi:ketosteroid isomerase-like protein
MSPMPALGLNGARVRRLLVLVVGLALLAACGDSVSTTTAAATTTTGAPTTTTAPSITSTTTLPATTTTTTEPDPVARTAALVEGFAAAWAADDPEALSAYYADEVLSYDATAGGVAFDKTTIDNVLQHHWAQGRFQVALNSFFVSPDGRFAATIGTFSEQDLSGALVPVPYASLLAVDGDLIVWVYDYYGGAMSATELMPTIPPNSMEAGSSEAQATVAATMATVERWIAAYNDRDTAAFLGCYADELRYVDLVSPDWRVLDKAGLAEDVASHFPRAQFESRLEPSFHSALDSFIVSADGRFAVVQGAYKDEGIPSARLMVVILGLQDGVIVGQYNFMSMAGDLLQP